MAATTPDDGWSVVSTTPDPASAASAPVPGAGQADPWSVVSQHPIAGPSDSPLTDAGRFATTAGVNAMAGLESFPHLFTQGVDWFGNKVGLDVGADAALSAIPHPANPNYPLVPDFQTAKNTTYNAWGGTEYQPSTWAGRRGMDATTAGILGVTDPASIPAAIGAGAVGGEGAELFPNHPFAAALAGGFLGGGAVNQLFNAGGRFGASILDNSRNDTYSAFKELGLPTDLAGTTTGDPALVQKEMQASRIASSAGKVAAARGNLMDQWQDRLNRTADDIGGPNSSTTATDVGHVLQSDASDWLDNFKQDTGQLWQDFSNKVPPTTPTAVTNYQQALTDILGNFKGAPATGAAVQPGTVKNLSDALGVDLQGGTNLPWQAVQSLRTAIGEKLANPQTVSDTSQAALKRLYGALSDDMQTGASNVSPDAYASFIKANAATLGGHGVLEDYLNPIINAPSPEKATEYAMAEAKKGGDRIEGLTLNLPNAQSALGSYALRNAATDTESPTSFATAMAGKRPLYSPEARNMLFPDAQTQSVIDNLTKTGDAMKPMERDMASSPAPTNTPQNMWARMATAREGGELGAKWFGEPGRWIGTGLGVVAPDLQGQISKIGALGTGWARYYGQNPPFNLRQPGLLNQLMIGGTTSQR